MKLNKTTRKALAKASAQHSANKAIEAREGKRKVAKTDDKATATKTKRVKKVAMTSNFWRKLKEAGSYGFGVKWYNLRKVDFKAQAVTEWSKVAGKVQKSVLITEGSNGVLHGTVEHKGNVIRVTKDGAFDLAQLACKWGLFAGNGKAVDYVKRNGKRMGEKTEIDGKTFAKGGWLLGVKSHHQTFTDGAFLFEAKDARDGDSKHVTILG